MEKSGLEFIFYDFLDPLTLARKGSVRPIGSRFRRKERIWNLRF